MKRPNKKDYLTSRMYYDDLKKYCDELESTIDMLRTDDHFYQNKCNELEKQIEELRGDSLVCKLSKYEKALDKACKQLEQYYIAKDVMNIYQRSKEEWKEWCLKDEIHN